MCLQTGDGGLLGAAAGGRHGQPALQLLPVGQRAAQLEPPPAERADVGQCALRVRHAAGQPAHHGAPPAAGALTDQQGRADGYGRAGAGTKGRCGVDCHVLPCIDAPDTLPQLVMALTLSHLHIIYVLVASVGRCLLLFS